MNKKALIEAGKELGRVVLVAIIPVLYTSINTSTGEIHLDYRVILAVSLVAVIKSVDKFIHKSDIELKGLLPF